MFWVRYTHWDKDQGISYTLSQTAFGKYGFKIYLETTFTSMILEVDV